MTLTNGITTLLYPIVVELNLFELGQDSKTLYTKITIEKYVQILLDKYEKFTGSDLKLQKLASAPVMTLIKSKLEEPK